MSILNENAGQTDDDIRLTTQGAQQLATPTKSAPQKQGFTSRWFLKVLPWVHVPGGTYQVNSVVRYDDKPPVPVDRYGHPVVGITVGESRDALPSTSMEYTIKPRRYDLNVARTILRIPALVADIYNFTMNQTEQQLKLTVETLREQQEDAMINNPDFGLLSYVRDNKFSPKVSNADGRTLDNLDKLITQIRDPHFILAQPSAIAAIGQACTAAGIYPQSMDMGGHMVPCWRGIPILSCTKLPVVEKPNKATPKIAPTKTTTLLAMRTGEQNHGVIGLHQTGIPDEYEPSLNVRFMSIDENAMISYLVSVYFSVVPLVPDALGVLEDLEVGR